VTNFLSGIGSTLGAPVAIASTFNRHLLDPSLTFGVSSSRYNAQDKYRRNYTDGQRVAAGLGASYGAALPAVGLGVWMARGAKVPGLPKALGNVQVPGLEAVAVAAEKTIGKAQLRGVSPQFGRAAAVTAGTVALGAAAVVGGIKVKQIVEDDGHLGSAGGAVGVLAGAAAGAGLGKLFHAGKYTPVAALGGMVAGGVGGYLGGKAIKVGEGHIGEEKVQAARVDKNVLDRANSFIGGANRHLTEVGPTSQGISLGYAWGMRDIEKKTATTAERSGGMHGDLIAAGIMGGGALAIGGAMAGVARYLPKGAQASALATTSKAGAVLAHGPLTNALESTASMLVEQSVKLSAAGKGKQAASVVGLAMTGAAGLAGYAALKQYEAQTDYSGGNKTQGLVAAGATLAATAGTALLISKAPGFAHLSAAPKVAASAIGAAALVSVISSVRLPLQQFYNDAKDAHAARGADPLVTGLATSVAGVAGGGVALKTLSKAVPAGGVQLGKVHLPKGVLVAAGTALAAGATGFAGWGLSATMPDIKTVTISGAAGAAAGAGLGAWAKGIGVLPGMAVGAAVGITASAIAGKD
jgi:hypothetical protein